MKIRKMNSFVRFDAFPDLSELAVSDEVSFIEGSIASFLDDECPELDKLLEDEDADFNLVNGYLYLSKPARNYSHIFARVEDD